MPMSKAARFLQKKKRPAAAPIIHTVPIEKTPPGAGFFVCKRKRLTMT